MARNIWLAEIVAYDPSLPGTRTLRFTTGLGFRTGGADVPANAYFRPGMSQPATIRRDLFGAGATTGRATTSAGELVLANPDGALDYLLEYAFDGRAVEIWYGPQNGTFPTDFTSLLVGTMQQARFTRTEVRISLRDKLADLESPLQTNRYAGDNSNGAGVEGDATLRGKPKPLSYGECFNVQAVPVNTSKLIYQVHDGALAGIPDVRDRGVSLRSSVYSWVPVSSGTALTLRAVAYGNGHWVAVGDGVILVTNDPTGLTGWVDVHANLPSGHDDPDNDHLSVHYCEDLDLWFIGNSAFATGNYRAQDPLNDTWIWTSSGSMGMTGTTQIVAWASHGSVVVAAGDLGYVSSSVNGSAWTNRINVDPTFIQPALVWAGDKFVAVLATNAVKYAGPTAVTWSDGPSIDSALGTIRGAAFGNGRIIVVGATGGVADAPQDLTGWTVRFVTATANNRNFRGVCFGGPPRLFLAAAGTTDGLTWAADDPATWSITDQASFSTSVPLGVAASDDAFVVVGEDGTIFCAQGFGSYASLADLEDDDLKPARGTYKAYLAGGMFRLGSPPAGIPTANVVQGASAAARTSGQVWEEVLTKAGKTAPGANRVNNIWTGGATFTTGITDPAGGTSATRMDDPVVDAIYLNAQSTMASFVGNGTKYVCFVVREVDCPANGHYLSLRDTTAAAHRALAHVTSWTDGRPNVTMSPGLGTFVKAVPVGNDYWAIYCESTTVTAANTHIIIIYPAAAVAETGIIEVWKAYAWDDDPTAFDWNALDPDLLDAGNSAVIGIHVPPQDTPTTDVLTRIARTPGAWWGADKDGLYRIQRLEDPASATPVMAIRKGKMIRPLQRLNPNDANGGLPSWQVVVKHSRNYAPSADLAFSLSDELRTLLAIEFQEAVYDDATILTVWPNSQPFTVETLFTDPDDALEEAIRQLDLRGVQRHRYETTIPLDDDSLALDLNRPVLVEHDRFGMSAGEKFVIISMEPDAASKQLYLNVWG